MDTADPTLIVWERCLRRGERFRFACSVADELAPAEWVRLEFGLGGIVSIVVSAAPATGSRHGAKRGGSAGTTPRRLSRHAGKIYVSVTGWSARCGIPVGVDTLYYRITQIAAGRRISFDSLRPYQWQLVVAESGETHG